MATKVMLAAARCSPRVRVSPPAKHDAHVALEER